MKNTETYKEFMSTIPHVVFKEVAKGVNQLCGLSKTSSMVASLFATLPVKIELRHITNQPKPSKKLNALNEFTHAYVKHDDSSCVYIAFWYDSEKHIKRISKAIYKHPEFFTYLYLREALKLTRRMNTKTHYNMMSAIIKHNNPSIPAGNHYKYSIHACNFAINSMIKQLFSTLPNANPMSKSFNKIIEGQAYSPRYNDLTEIDVLIDMLKNGIVPDSVNLDEDWLWDDMLGILPATVDGAIPVDEAIVTDIGEVIESQLGNMSRGTASSAIFEKLFSAKKVKTGWFKKLVAQFNRDVHYMTNNFRSEWSNLNITYRGIFKAPVAKYEDNKLSLILSIDHSGSVSTENLSKLLYLIEKQGHSITDLHVIIHDTEIVKQFQLSSTTNITDDPQFKEALAHRLAVGGTSNLAVFARINELLTTKQIDKNKTIYICFGDMYSDIPESIKIYPLIKQLNPIWLSCGIEVPDSCGGTNIAMQ